MRGKTTYSCILDSIGTYNSVFHYLNEKESSASNPTAQLGGESLIVRMEKCSFSACVFIIGDVSLVVPVGLESVTLAIIGISNYYSNTWARPEQHLGWGLIPIF